MRQKTKIHQKEYDATSKNDSYTFSFNEIDQ